MVVSYTTITSKGQITLPAEARRILNLRPGQKVAVRIVDGHLEIDPPSDIASVRSRLRAEAERRGTWGAVAKGGDGWRAQADARIAES